MLGLAAAGAPGGEAGESTPSEGSDGLSAGTVTATDGSLDRLLGLLDAEAGEERRIVAERLLVDVGSTTIEITGTDGGIELRERREDRPAGAARNGPPAISFRPRTRRSRSTNSARCRSLTTTWLPALPPSGK